MKELETLLNALIKMGWKPFGMEIHAEYIDRIFVESSTVHIIFKGDGEYIEGLRSLVSLESGLWQFCMEKGLYKEDNGLIERYPDANKDDHSFHYSGGYEYRLLESALVPEEELGQFLIDNIKTK